MLPDSLRVHLHDAVEREEAQILEVLVGIFDEGAELGDAQTHQRNLVRQADDAGLDALVEKGHGRGGVDEVGQRLHQALGQPLLQRSKRSKLFVKKSGGSLEVNRNSSKKRMSWAATSLMILMSIQLLVDDWRILNRVGASGR